MELRDYQIELAIKAADKVQEYGLCYIAAEPRCGKTGMAFQTAKLLLSRSVLFITKLKAISSIESDYTGFGFNKNFELTCINYESIHKVLDKEYDLIIIDESHRNGAFPKASESAKIIKENWSYLPMILLSATPSAESYSQIYHQLWISVRSPFAGYKNFYAWSNDFVRVKKKMINGQQFNDYSRADQDKIKAATAHLFISFTQAESGFTQSVEEEVLLVRMNPTTYTLAKKLINHKIFTGKGGEVVLADTPVKLQSKLHQVFSGTVITESENINAIVFDKSKASMIAEVFADKKIAVFYKFVAEGIMLKAHIGRMTTDDPKVFNESKDLVFISQFISGREGVDLSTADALIFINIDFSALSYIQSKSRIQTRDRTTPAKIYWVFAEGGIEPHIYERVKNKMDFTNSYFKKVYGITDTIKNKDGPGKEGLDGSKDHELLEAGMA